MQFYNRISFFLSCLLLHQMEEAITFIFIFYKLESITIIYLRYKFHSIVHGKTSTMKTEPIEKSTYGLKGIMSKKNTIRVKLGECDYNVVQ